MFPFEFKAGNSHCPSLEPRPSGRGASQAPNITPLGWWRILIRPLPTFLICVPQAEAHERLADAAQLNEQPHRALEELHKARALLHTLRDQNVLPHDDRHLADVEFSLGVAQLQAGDAAAAAAHYRQAVRILTLRQAKGRRRQIDAQIELLSGEVGAAPGGGVAPDAAAEAADAGVEAEVSSIGEIIREIEKRLGEIDAALTSQA
jgi:tetratricopeptide (TPR) repeat protein